MRKVKREEIVDYVTYDEQRDAFRAKVIAEKAKRRAFLPPCFTFLFENADTVRYQVQEMMRAERIVKEAEIRHELDTYNELLGGDGELGVTVLIEIEDAKERDEKLVAWRGIVEKMYAELDDGTRAYARFDPRQVGDDRLSSVQYLKLDVKGQAPVALGVDHPALTTRAELAAEVRAALAEDLRAG